MTNKKKDENVCDHNEDYWCQNCIDTGVVVSQTLPDGTVTHGRFLTNIPIMTNPSLQEIDEQFEKEFPLIEIVGENEADGTFVLEKDREKVKSFIHKVIANRDEALRKDFYKIDRYYTNPKGKVMVYVDDMSSLLSKE